MRLIRKLVDKLIQRFIDALLTAHDDRHLHPKRQLLLNAQSEAAEYAAENMTGAVILDNRFDILSFALERVKVDGLYLEFGVAHGDSIAFIGDKTDCTVHGFDSFEGLPEDWGGRHEAKGHYSTQGRLPDVPENVILHKGWFSQSVPEFLASNQEMAAFIHIDCDLHGSTELILNKVVGRIQRGTIIVFDEYFNFPSWKEHEYKAFQEFVENYRVDYKYLCWGYQQVVVIVNDIKKRQS